MYSGSVYSGSEPFFVQGRSFGKGFVGSFVGSKYGGGNIIKAAIVAGTSSVISGGKFKNGAASAVYTYLAKNGGNLLSNSSEVAKSLANAAKEIGKATLDIAGKIWNLPNTVIGLAFGGIGHLAGLALGTNPYISYW